MRINVLFLFALLILFAAAGCDKADEKPAPQTIDQADLFLQTWLVEQDLQRASQMFHPRFDESPTGRLSDWPAELRAMSRSMRALNFPAHSGCLKTKCAKLADCIRVDEGSGPYERTTSTISEKEVEQFAELRPWMGRRVSLVTFLFRECETGGILVLDDEGSKGDPSVLMLAYLAPVTR